MAVNPRNKGQFVQAGTPHIVPKINGSFLSMDGMVDFDTNYERDDYPVLYAVIGNAYDDPSTTATQFRTPSKEQWLSKSVNVKELKVDFDDTSPVSLGKFPVGTILRINSNVTAIWNGTSPTIEIGTGADPDAVMISTTVDLTQAKADSFLSMYSIVASETELFVTITPNGSTQGSVSLVVEYTGFDDNHKHMIRF